MSKVLVECLHEQTKTMFYNLMISMKTCDWEQPICGTPAWRYMYHTLHSCDRWFFNPAEYTEPQIHAENLDKVDLECSKVLTEDELWGYYYQVRDKALSYLDSLDDEDLYSIPENYDRTRLEVIVGQIRHFCVHTGIFNGVTIAVKNKYPVVVGIEINERLTDCLYDE